MYVSRTLIIQKGTSAEAVITEDQLASIQGPLIILGEPGLGKTELTKQLSAKLGTLRLTAGSFSRCKDLTKLAPPEGKPIIIDGLDEISPTQGRSAVDEILSKLSELGYPRFVLSCRSADWEGASARHKILEDYGGRPTTALLRPLSVEDARQILEGKVDKDKASELIDIIDERGLDELLGNPLTVELLAEVAADGRPLPTSRSDLFERASPLLLKERNPGHQGKGAAKISATILLDAAGKLFAHLLLSGMVGIAIGQRDDVPSGYVSDVDIAATLPPGSAEVLRTRVFRPDSENLIVPVHRLVAEYLAAAWLAKHIGREISERRVFQALTTPSGVPTALRGLHAWLAHFCPRVAARCIAADPYGVLRYGETDDLSPAQARILISALAELADEDPYFRSEDWGVRGVRGLARVELKDELLQLVTSSNRPVQLSSLLLQSLRGTDLSRQLAPLLLSLIQSMNTPFIERLHAMEALVDSGVTIDWRKELEALVQSTDPLSERLALETIVALKGAELPPTLVASTLVAHHGLNRQRRNDTLGVAYSLPDVLGLEQAGLVLDELAKQFAAAATADRHWVPNSEITTVALRLIARCIQHDASTSPERLWQWVKHLECRSGYSDDATKTLSEFFSRNDDLRRRVQMLAFSSPSMGDSPWMAIVSDLPEVVDGLALTLDDINHYLKEIAGREVLSNFDTSLWTDLDRLATRRGEVLGQHKDAIELGTSRHRALHIIHSETIRNRGRDWEKEREKERAKSAEQQRRRFAKHRARFHAIREDIATGKAVGALDSIARAYMGLYSDLSSDGKPSERLSEWLGPELTEIAQRGFIAVLSRSDIPTASAIAKLKSEGKIYTVERPLLCGISELYAKQKSFRGVRPSVLQSALAAWWDMPDWNARTLGQGIQDELEASAFANGAERLEFLKAMMEPHISQGRDHVPGLYALARDEAMQSFAGRLALEWLKRFPTANDQVQAELLEIGVKYSPKAAFSTLISSRESDLAKMTKSTRHMWLAAGFVADVEGFQGLISQTALNEPEILWAIRRLSSALADDSDTPILLKKVAMQEFIVREFVAKWPCVETPRTSWGDSHPHDAMRFILNTITSIASNRTPEASEALDRLLEVQTDEGYRDHIKHMRARQRRLRRDSEYHAPSLVDVTQLLAGGLPGTVDDLKAMTLDRLETVQKYVRDGDTRGWEKFWSGDTPLDEDTCRNRLLDDLRPHFDAPISVMPEILMPDTARADLIVVHRQHGLPIEIKGQWHKEVWDAALTQLDEQYTRDWRAFGRGIYLVFWHGPNRIKRLKKHPDGRNAPTSRDEFHKMLLARLSDVERSRIDVVVFDVSKPTGKSRYKLKT